MLQTSLTLTFGLVLTFVMLRTGTQTMHPNSKSKPKPKPLFSSPAEALSRQLETCAHRSQLTQIHTHLIRAHHLPFLSNSLMRAYLRLSLPLPSLSLLPLLLRSPFKSPDRYTLPIAFKAAARIRSLPVALQLHSLSLRLGLSHHRFSESGLISLYSKLGLLGDARKVFDESPHRGLGSWNAVVSGLAQGGRAAEAVGAFVAMVRAGVAPDGYTMVSVASACGSLGAVRLAEQVHKFVLQVKGLERLDVTLSNSLVDMYCKCGRTDLAGKVFAKMKQRNVSTWTSLIMGLATHGQETLALEFFERMQQDGVRPNHVTLVAVLSACAHGGLVEEGMVYLEKMKEVYGVEPTVAHYGCVVDMLGRAGRVDEAEEVADGMPMRANVTVWGALLGACEKHGKVAVGERTAAKLLELEPWNDGVYVVLSNVYAAAGVWVEAERVRRLMKGRRVAKIPGYSSAATGS